MTAVPIPRSGTFLEYGRESVERFMDVKKVQLYMLTTQHYWFNFKVILQNFLSLRRFLSMTFCI